MKRIIVAIGGGENGRLLKNGVYASYDTEKIDKEIVSLTNKKIQIIYRSCSVS